MLVYQKPLLHQRISLLQSNCSSCQSELMNEHEIIFFLYNESHHKVMKQLNCKLKSFKICSVLQLHSQIHHCQNCANVTTFKLINYMWDFYITKTENDNWNRCDKIQVQKEEIVYSHDIDYNYCKSRKSFMKNSIKNSCWSSWQNSSDWTSSFS